MALAEFLRAFKQLITTPLEFPNTEAARLKFFQKKFPELSHLEQKDLAKIPPTKFQIYTGTIFRGEGNLLKNRLPVSFAHLEKIWNKLSVKAFSPAMLAQETHLAFPWQGYQTNALVRSFRKYFFQLTSNNSELVWLNELVEFEAKLAELKRAPNTNSTGKIWLSECLQLSIADLLNKTVVPNSALSLLTTQYDITTVHSDYIKTQKICYKPSMQRCHLAISRNNKLFPRYLPINGSEYAWLEKLLSSGTLKLESLADVIIKSDSLAANTQPAEAFQAFLKRTFEFEEVGLINLTEN